MTPTPPADAPRPAVVPFLLGATCAAIVLLVADPVFRYLIRPDISATVEVLTRQQAAWNRGDLDGFMADYQMSDDTTMYSGGDVRQGWTTIIDRYRKTYQTNGATMGELTFDNINAILISSNAALVRGRWTVKLPDKTPTGLFTLLMRRTPEGWKIVHDHTSAAKEK